MDEDGETPTYYLWPKGHEEGESIPSEWFDRLHQVLRDNDIRFETV